MGHCLGHKSTCTSTAGATFFLSLAKIYLNLSMTLFTDVEALVIGARRLEDIGVT